jgi:hypothetical protein
MSPSAKPPTDAERPDPVRAAPRRFRFEPAGGLVSRQVRKAGEARGFAVARVLTHWAEVAGPDLARLCRPQRISYGKGGFGATLVVEAPGAAAPLVSMRLDALRERINAVYGYAAIARIQLVQGGSAAASPPGLAEAQAPFAGAGLRSDNLAPPSPARLAQAQAMLDTLTDGVADPGLKAALDRLALNILGRSPQRGALGRNDRKD